MQYNEKVTKKELFKLRKKYKVKLKILTTEIVRDIINQKGGKVGKKFKYISAHSKFSIKCGKGHKFTVIWNTIQQGQWCPECAGLKIDENYVLRCIKKKKLKLDSNFIYKNAFTRFWVTCKNGHRWKTFWNNIQQGRGCPYCTHQIVDIKEIKRIIKKRGGKLSKNFEYKNSRTKFLVKDCGKGHSFKTNWDKIKGDHWCPICAYIMNGKKHKTSIEKIIKFIKKKGGSVKKNFEYKDGKRKIWITCQKGHKWRTTWFIISQGSWCPYCRNFVQQEKFRKKIEKYFNAKFPIRRPLWLRIKEKGYPELDGYNQKRKIAFEYQGRQHYEPCYLNGYSKKKFEEIRKRDAFKIRQCSKRNILLIVIPYWIPESKWDKIIKTSYNKFKNRKNRETKIKEPQMPNPANYSNTAKGYKKYMDDCMHQTVHKERKRPEHGVAQCLNMWRQHHGPRHPGKGEGLTPEQSLGKCLNIWRQEHPREKSIQKMAMNVVLKFIPLTSKQASVMTDLNKAEKSDKPSVFLGGLCDNKNEWRKEIKKEIDSINFIDPYDSHWDPQDNIYDELTGLMKTDYVIFYKGGEGSKKEKDFMDQMDKKYKEFEDLDELKDYLSKLSTYDLKTASFPKHPDTVIISRKDSWTGHILSEIDIYSYYEGIKDHIIKELKDKNLFVRLKTDSGFIYVRHPFTGNTKFIRINTQKDFDEYNTGRVVEFHTTSQAMTNQYVVDFDAVEDWATTKKITADVADMLNKLPEVKSVELYFTGKRGFHVRGKLKKPIPIDKAREDLKEHLKEAFGDRDDLVLGESPSGKKGALGVSPMKLNGGQVALWSLRVTGLCCVEVPRAKLAGFKREDARPEKVYKKLTGKTLVPVKEKEAANRVVQAFLNQ